MLNRWARELGTRVKFVQIDVDADEELASDAGVEAMPTFVVFKKGKVYEKVVGTEMKKLRTAIEELLEDAGGYRRRCC